VLTVNCGSSSLKVELLRVDARGRVAERMARAAATAIGGPPGRAEIVAGDTTTGHVATLRDHTEAVALLLELLQAHAPGPSVADVVAHRVVHGGPRRAPRLLDARERGELAALDALAPLHNRVALDVAAALDQVPELDAPAVAVFDTAFHHDLPDRAATYALPVDLARRHGIRRFGFHGLAHRSMWERWVELAGVGARAGDARVVTLQLGAGCSAAAVRGGRSVDTSMGFTPLEGLVMATRCGDLDPAIPSHLARHEGLAPDALDEVLSRQSGLLGLSGTTSDMTELLRRRAAGDDRARLAVDVFCYRLRKQIGAYLAALGGADAVVFGGGIGEHASEARALACAGLEWAGLVLDPDRNAAAVGIDGRISADGAAVEAWVVTVDEAAVMAGDAARWLRSVREGRTET
jgi:acetate kinase